MSAPAAGFFSVSLDRDVKRMMTIMKAAGKALLGVEVLVGTPDVVRWPDRFIPEDKKGAHDTYRLILRELRRLETGQGDTSTFHSQPTPTPLPHEEIEMAEIQAPTPLPTPTPNPSPRLPIIRKKER
jgi:hypothetical protein